MVSHHSITPVPPSIPPGLKSLKLRRGAPASSALLQTGKSAAGLPQSANALVCSADY
jgi:hypothetical protein